MSDGPSTLLPLETARYRALAASGAVLVAFVGVCHEVVGETLFPWGPAFVGGALPWHALGFFAIAIGLNLLLATLGLGHFPVVPFALAMAVVGAFFTIVAAVLHGQFHLFALTVCGAGLLVAHAHAKAERLARG